MITQHNGVANKMKSLSTREKIIREAVRLINQRGYSETTVGEIEAAAGLSRRAGGFYRHFKSKEDMLVRALEPLTAEIMTELRLDEVLSLNSIRDELLLIARTLIRHAEAYRPLRLLLQREGYRLPALRKAAKRANAKLAAMDVVPWVESALARSGARKANARATALMIFGPIVIYFIGQDRGDPPFGIDAADDFLFLWADHWAAWFAGGKPSREQQTTADSFLKAARERPGNSKGERRWTRDELHER